MNYYECRTDTLAISRAFLKLNKQTLRLGIRDVAEHLLQILEELARTEPECSTARDQAYLAIIPYMVSQR